MTSTDLSIHDGTIDRFDPRDQRQIELLRRMIATDLNDDEFAVFLRVAAHTNLDPFRKQIYGLRIQGRLVVMTGIDGLRAVAARSGLHAGTDDAVFTGLSRNKGYPGEARVTVYKLVGGIRVPFTATARWDEFYPGDGGRGATWRDKPHVMLGKCAEAQALRKAFPEELSGVEVEEAFVSPDGRTIDPEPREQTREEALADRFAALPIGLKVAFTSWAKAEKIPAPGHRDEEQLDAMDATLAALERRALNPDAEPEPEPEDAETVDADDPQAECIYCSDPAVATDAEGDPYCADHLPPED